VVAGGARAAGTVEPSADAPLGVGLSVDEAERIFEAFFTTKPQGTGMGLSISRRIIASHGGRLGASPNAGRGATFQFTLPPT
jgi:signal transduction histidine kinase